MNSSAMISVVGPSGPLQQQITEVLGATHLHHKEFNTIDEFLSADGVSDSGCVIAHLRRFGVGGLDLLVRLKRFRPTLPLILVAHELSIRMVVRIMKEGAQTVLDSPVPQDELYFAVREALQENERRVAEASNLDNLLAQFANVSVGEREVLDYMCEGLSNRQIAEKLDVHVRTVEARKHRLLSKSGAQSVPKLLLSYQQLNSCSDAAVPPGTLGHSPRIGMPTRAVDSPPMH